MRRVWLITGVIAAAAIGFDLLFPDFDHPESWWHITPGFDLVFGLVGCAATIWISKWFGTFVSKPENYYEQDSE